jgi:hypothetical protein
MRNISNKKRPNDPRLMTIILLETPLGITKNAVNLMELPILFTRGREHGRGKGDQKRGSMVLPPTGGRFGNSLKRIGFTCSYYNNLNFFYSAFE